MYASYWDHPSSFLSANLSSMVATNCQTTLEHIPICLKPTPKEPALMMISLLLLGFRSHLFWWMCCNCPYHLCRLLAPIDFSGAKGPPARALGWTTKVGKANVSQKGSLESELWIRDPWLPVESRQNSVPNENALLQGSIKREHPGGWCKGLHNYNSEDLNLLLFSPFD